MAYEDEFPLLSPIGLYAAHIRGDGNCLFNALSDQLYGSQDQHAEIRARVIDHMRREAAYYKQFLEVYPGGGIRRNPKRKCAGSPSLHASGSGWGHGHGHGHGHGPDTAAPSPEDVDRVFEEHVSRMARGGTWGDNMEIQAFAVAFDVNVKVYQRDIAYVIAAPGGEARPYEHIAYHAWEHYSSIRNINGPHTGLPNVSPTVTEQPRIPGKARNSLPGSAYPPWLLAELARAYPAASPAALGSALDAARGSVDDAYERLVAGGVGVGGADDESQASHASFPSHASSSQQSSSLGDDADAAGDADYDDARGRAKRQDRRLSRHSKAKKGAAVEAPLHLGAGRSLDDLLSVPAAVPGAGAGRPGLGPGLGPGPGAYRGLLTTSSSATTSTSDTDEWTPDPLQDGSTSSESEYSPSPLEAAGPGGQAGQAGQAQAGRSGSGLGAGSPPIRIKLSFQRPHKLAKPAGTKKPAGSASSAGSAAASARQRKELKKAAQKQAARERKLAAIVSAKAARQAGENPPSAKGEPLPASHPTMATTAMRTLYI